VLKSASPLSAGTSAGGANGVASFEVEEVVMKLAKKNDMAVLTFEVAESTMMGRRVNVKHDVKIEVLKPGDVERLKEPMCPQPDVSPICISPEGPVYLNTSIDTYLVTTSAEDPHYC